jgi:hypothetical protein
MMGKTQTVTDKLLMHICHQLYSEVCLLQDWLEKCLVAATNPAVESYITSAALEVGV